MLEELQSHNDEHVFEKSHSILSEYFDLEQYDGDAQFDSNMF